MRVSPGFGLRGSSRLARTTPSTRPPHHDGAARRAVTGHCRKSSSSLSPKVAIARSEGSFTIPTQSDIHHPCSNANEVVNSAWSASGVSSHFEQLRSGFAFNC